jgi:hypothetical protein
MQMAKRAQHDSDVQLGDTVRDVVSNFKGIVTSRTEYLNDCVRYGVQPQVDKDGKLPAGEYFDWHQLEIIKRGADAVNPSNVTLANEPTKLRATGGPQRNEPPVR